MHSEESPPGPTRGGIRHGTIYAVGAGLAAILSWYLFTPLSIQAALALDPSHVWTVAWAFQHGYAWGTDIIFTYGPLGFLRTRAYLPDGGWLPLLLAYFYTGTLGFLLWRIFKPFASPGAGGAVFGLAVLFLAGTFVTSPDALVFFVVLAGGYFCLEEKSWTFGEASLFLAFCALNLFVKYSFAILSLFLFLFLLVFWLVHRRHGLHLLVFAAASVAAGWAAGMTPLTFVQYLWNTWPVASGFSKAMQIWGPEAEWMVFAGLLVFINTVFLWGLLRERPVKHFVFHILWISLVCFIAWRQGFVRHDAHAVSAGAFLLLLALFWLKDRLDRGGSAMTARAGGVSLLLILGVASSSVYYAGIQRNYLGDGFFLDRLTSMAGAPVERFHRSVILPFRGEEMNAAWERRLERLREQRPLPFSIDSSIDFYNARSGILLAHELDYHPRPMFQSYSAYTPGLIRRNRDHLLREDAPQYLITDLTTLMRRPPMLDDGLSWLEIWRYYEPVDRDLRLLLWQRVPDANPKTVSLELAAEGEGRLREDILLDAWHGEPLWVELEFRHSWAGRLQNLLFKPSPLLVEIGFADGVRLPQATPPGMTATGFLLSPHVAGPESLELMLEGGTSRGYSPALRWVTSFRALEERHLLRCFRPDFKYRVYRLGLDDIPAQGSAYVEHARKERWGPLAAYSSMRALADWTTPRVVSQHDQLPPHVFAHAPMVLELDNPWAGRTVQIAYGMYDASWQGGNTTDGVTFRILASNGDEDPPKLLWEHSLDPLNEEQDRGVQQALVSIPKGYSVLVLETDPRENNQWDWSYWGAIEERVGNQESNLP